MDWVELFSVLGESIITWFTGNVDLWITFILTLIISKLYFRFWYIKRHLPEDIRLKLDLKQESIDNWKLDYVTEHQENIRLRSIINGLTNIKLLSIKTNNLIEKENLYE